MSKSEATGTTVEDPPPKPMTREERRSLERIVKTDFESLRAEIQAQATEAAQRDTDRINDEFAEQESELIDVGRELREVVEQARRLVEDKMTELKDRGFAPGPGQTMLGISYPSSWTVKGKQAALTESANRIAQAKQRAFADLVRQENEAIRQVVLTSVVSQQANALLNSFPTASEVMSTALNAVDQRRAALESGTVISRTQPTTPIQ